MEPESARVRPQLSDEQWALICDLLLSGQPMEPSTVSTIG